MSFIHVLSQIGKGALKAAPLIGQAVGGPIGLVITTAANIGTAELEHGSGNGEAKASQVVSSVLNSPVVASSPVPVADKASHIRCIINGLVMVLNGIAMMWPEEVPPK